MGVLSNSASIIISTSHLSFTTQKSQTQFQIPSTNLKFLSLPKKNNPFILSSSSSPFSSFSSQTGASPTTTTPSISLSSSSTATDKRHWVVVLKTPSLGFNSKAEAIDYYVKTLERVLGSEKDAQMCIYDASWDTQLGFCCHIDEQTSRELACLPEVLSVRPDPDFNSVQKDYGSLSVQLEYESNSESGTSLLFPIGNTKRWLVRMDKPGIGIVTKAQMVDYYAQILAKVLGNEKDAQMCIYHISWQSNFGFCCELDDECARELAGMPGILSVLPDTNFGSENKDYGGNSTDLSYSSEASQTAPVRTKKLFVTGLSFYTSEKTLREAFEGFGELVEVKVIMDKISKRSKGYAFIEYTTEEAASAALKEMNGKIINGWMIVVDAAKPKSSPPRQGRGRTR